MCGIAGILRVAPAPVSDPAPIPDPWLAALDQTIAHRGPDGSGVFSDVAARADGALVSVALVHRRLSIVDHEGGGQPMMLARDGRDPNLLAVVFNGCIYNHARLRARWSEDLSGRPPFRSDHSDTEVILHAYASHKVSTRRKPEDDVDRDGESWTDELHGMYALALWDRAEARLVLARDRFGEKPLYVAASADRRVFVFASSAGAIVAAARAGCPIDLDEPANLDRPGVLRWMAFGHDRTRTPWSSIRQVDRGTDDELLVLCEDASAKPPRTLVDRFWLVVGLACGAVLLPVILLYLAIVALRRDHDLSPRGGAEGAVERIENALLASVRERLTADVPVGVFLSGGIDSSLVAAMAAEGDRGLTTICLRMADRRLDESPFASEVAAKIGSRHVTADADPSHAADDLERLIGTLGLPFGDSSILPTYWLCRAATDEVGVALSGDGGDELFYGYERYRAALLLRWLWPGLALLPTGGLDRSDPLSKSERRARMIAAARGEGYTDLLAVFPSADLRRMVRIGRERPHRLEREAAPGSGARAAARWLDCDHYLPGDILRKTDAASMAVPIEVRAPFLAPEVWSVAQSVGVREHMPRGRTKALLREIARRRLGAQIACRPKQGFAVPIGDWLRNDVGGLGTRLLDGLASGEPFGPLHRALEIDVPAARRMADEHFAAGGARPPFGPGAPRRRDHGQRLFLLLSLSIWAAWFSRGRSA
ncbi:MAG: asparagine synthase (glutamine-hydrolyzing) [Phycisphaerales bacterium]|nr:asparagine synthase (glutamine-hydrolyzing) [Phycisphaerales bacterium]